jgi:hypothetical protein
LIFAQNMPGKERYSRNARTGQGMPAKAPPKLRFELFPMVRDIPFHWVNPVTGRSERAPASKDSFPSPHAAKREAAGSGMSPQVDGALRESGSHIEEQNINSLSRLHVFRTTL